MEKTTKKFYLIYLFFILVITLNSLHGKFHVNYDLIYKAAVICIYLIVGLFFLYSFAKKKIISDSLSISIFVFGIYTFVISLINDSGISNALISTSWCVALIFGYNLSQYSKQNIIESNIRYNIVALILVSLFFLYNFVLNSKYHYIGSLIGISHVYYYSIILFYYFCYKQDIKMQLILSIIILILGFMSYKRTSILIVFVGFFIYLLALSIYSLKFKIKNFFIFCLFVIVILLIFNAFSDRYIERRFISSFSDGGSGRLRIWSSIFDRFISSSTFQKLFGHGYFSVLNPIEGYTHSAHNDFLEILFDYGLIGVLYFQFILFFIFRNIYLYLKKQSNQYLVAPFGFIFSIWFFMGMFSHLIFYPVHNLSYMFFLGIILGILNKEISLNIIDDCLCEK